MGVSKNTVGKDVLHDKNNSPDFNQSETKRSIPEDTAVGMPVGDPVDVDRNEDGDILTYEIVIVDGPGESSTAEDVGNPATSALSQRTCPSSPSTRPLVNSGWQRSCLLRRPMAECSVKVMTSPLLASTQL